MILLLSIHNIFRLCQSCHEQRVATFRDVGHRFSKARISCGLWWSWSMCLVWAGLNHFGIFRLLRELSFSEDFPVAAIWMRNTCILRAKGNWRERKQLKGNKCNYTVGGGWWGFIQPGLLFMPFVSSCFFSFPFISCDIFSLFPVLFIFFHIFSFASGSGGPFYLERPLNSKRIKYLALKSWAHLRWIFTPSLKGRIWPKLHSAAWSIKISPNISN